MKPIELCDKYAGSFQALNRKLRISNDFFVRTTQPKHYLCVRRASVLPFVCDVMPRHEILRPPFLSPSPIPMTNHVMTCHDIHRPLSLPPPFTNPPTPP